MKTVDFHSSALNLGPNLLKNCGYFKVNRKQVDNNINKEEEKKI